MTTQEERMLCTNCKKSIFDDIKLIKELCKYCHIEEYIEKLKVDIEAQYYKDRVLPITDDMGEQEISERYEYMNRQPPWKISVAEKNNLMGKFQKDLNLYYTSEVKQSAWGTLAPIPNSFRFGADLSKLPSKHIQSSESKPNLFNRLVVFNSSDSSEPSTFMPPPFQFSQPFGNKPVHNTFISPEFKFSPFSSIPPSPFNSAPAFGN